MTKRKNISVNKPQIQSKSSKLSDAPAGPAEPVPTPVAVNPARMPAVNVTQNASGAAARPAQTTSSGERVGRREAERHRYKQQQRNRTLLYAGIAVAVIAVAAWYIISQTSAANVGEFIRQEGPTAVHVTQGQAIPYLHNPPASGPHYPSPLAWTKYTTEQPEGNWVHNLEHGGIVMLYNCPSGCEDMLIRMRTFYDQQKPDEFNEVKLVMLPYARLPQPNKMALMAWNYELAMPDFDPVQAQRFYNAHVDQGPEKVP